MQALLLEFFMKPLKKVVSLSIEKVFSKRYGPAFAKIFTLWPSIVGEGLAGICVPIMIDKFDKVLIVHVYDQSKAIEMHFMQEIIVTRINALLKRQNIPQKIAKLCIQQNKYQEIPS